MDPSYYLADTIRDIQVYLNMYGAAFLACSPLALIFAYFRRDVEQYSFFSKLFFNLRDIFVFFFFWFALAVLFSISNLDEIFGGGSGYEPRGQGIFEY